MKPRWGRGKDRSTASILNLGIKITPPSTVREGHWIQGSQRSASYALVQLKTRVCTRPHLHLQVNSPRASSSRQNETKEPRPEHRGERCPGPRHNRLDFLSCSVPPTRSADRVRDKQPRQSLSPRGPRSERSEPGSTRGLSSCAPRAPSRTGGSQSFLCTVRFAQHGSVSGDAARLWCYLPRV